MIFRIALKECKEILREGRFRIIAGITIMLLIIAVFSGKAYYDSVSEQHRNATANTRKVWEAQGRKNPHSAAHYGTYAFKPRYALSLIDQGVDKYSGVSIYLEAHHRNESQLMAAQDQTALSRFGELTPDFLLLFIIPFLIILFGFNAYTRERESGTLRLLASQGVAGWKLALGKWFGIFIPVLLLIIPIYVIAASVLSRMSDYGEFSVGALSLLFLVYLVYYAVFTNVTLIISAVCKRSSTAFVILLGIWIVGCLAAPRLSTGMAQRIHPYPTQSQFEAKIAADKSGGLNVAASWTAESKRLADEALKQYGVDSVSQLPINLDGLLMQKGEEYDAKIWFRHYELLKETQHKQENVHQAMSLISPFLPTRFLSMAICRTDYNAHWDFSDAAEKHRLTLMDKMNTELMTKSKTGQWDYLADESLWASTPDFSYTPQSYNVVLRDNAGHLTVLLAWVTLSFSLMIVLTRNVKPV